MTVLVTLDLGSKAGFTRYDTEDGDLYLGWNDWSKVPPVDRAIAFGQWMTAILDGTILDVQGEVVRAGLRPVTVVGYEHVPFAGKGNSSEFIHKQEGLLQWLSQDIAFQAINVSTLKKFATGDGHAQKDSMVHAARYGIRTLGHPDPVEMKDDTADAFIVLAWMLTNAVKGWELPDVVVPD